LSRTGIAVISFDLSAVASWPSAMPASLAQAWTLWTGPIPFAASGDRPIVLPSMATTSPDSTSRRLSTQVTKQRRNSSGSSNDKSRPKASMTAIAGMSENRRGAGMPPARLFDHRRSDQSTTF
jgi:hypothetical protein